jgi:hypothetical protein
MGNLSKKIVINTCNGRFCVSHKAFVRLRELGQREALEEAVIAHWPTAAAPREPSLNQHGGQIPRDDRMLVQVVEELKEEANGHCAALKIVEIPHDIRWHIEGVNGIECVSEVHREWA